MLELIEMWLHAGILDGKEMVFPDTGSPQGSVATPILGMPARCVAVRKAPWTLVRRMGEVAGGLWW